MVWKLNQIYNNIQTMVSQRSFTQIIDISPGKASSNEQTKTSSHELCKTTQSTWNPNEELIITRSCSYICVIIQNTVIYFTKYHIDVIFPNGTGFIAAATQTSTITNAILTFFNIPIWSNIWNYPIVKWDSTTPYDTSLSQ